MKRNVFKKLMCIMMIFVIIIFGNNVFANVNPNYYDKSDNVQIDDIDKKVESASALDAIGVLINALASMAENLVTLIFGSITGYNMFPWADRVIFNTIPFLDINFLNPSTGSLFFDYSQNETMLASIVRNIYFTILTLSIGFLGIVVGIMAIRLAINSLASEKARAKEAIATCLFAILMLFTVHFMLSAIFFVNEKMVEIATSILFTSNSEIRTIQSLGEIFRDNAWVGNRWVYNRSTFTNAILYTMFITQSIAYFIAYLKRFFYVIVLSIMAPLVVIYDFLIKVAK